MVSTHSTVPNKGGPGTLLGNVGELVVRRYGEEFESVVGQVDPFPLGQARLEPAEDVELPWRWVALLGTLSVGVVGASPGGEAGRLLSALSHALHLGRSAGVQQFVTPLQRGGWRTDWRTALGVMVDAADAQQDGRSEMLIVERSREYFTNLAELAPSYGVEVVG